MYVEGIVIEEGDEFKRNEFFFVQLELIHHITVSHLPSEICRPRFVCHKSKILLVLRAPDPFFPQIQQMIVISD